MKYRQYISRGLLAFVLITIGFSLGRQTAPSSSQGPGTQAEAGDSRTPDAASEEKIVVYSAHMTFRCWECNQIEALTEELLNKEFSEEMEVGMIEYRTVDYMQDTEFAGRYNIASSTLVVARFDGDQPVDFERLDEVWTKSRKPEEFKAYVRSAIEAQLDQAEAGGEQS
ncbi:MAG: nitrophenyl compound nitroreductase subunit ArsF family protein [Candidatus Sumerlaeota bacterium]